MINVNKAKGSNNIISLGKITNSIKNNSVNIRPKNINKSFFISEILKQEYINNEFPEFI